MNKIRQKNHIPNPWLLSGESRGKKKKPQQKSSAMVCNIPHFINSKLKGKEDKRT
jgi:hypothetical protein